MTLSFVRITEVPWGGVTDKGRTAGQRAVLPQTVLGELCVSTASIPRPEVVKGGCW